jgi:hypothetical protein
MIVAPLPFAFTMRMRTRTRMTRMMRKVRKRMRRTKRRTRRTRHTTIQSPDPGDIPVHDPIDPIHTPGLTPATAHEVDPLLVEATWRAPVHQVTAHLTDRLARQSEIALRVVILGVVALRAADMMPRQIGDIGKTTSLSLIIGRDGRLWR